MNYKIIVTLFLVVLVSTSCRENIKLKYDNIAENITVQSNDEHPGKKLMETYCYACHNPTTSMNERLAPPMIAVKKHYINANSSKDEFINSMQAWIKNPTEDNAKMFGAVRRFGVMPKQVFAENDIKLIADYIFDNNIEQPEWFEEHEKEMKKKN